MSFYPICPGLCEHIQYYSSGKNVFNMLVRFVGKRVIICAVCCVILSTELIRLEQKPCFAWDDGDDKVPFILDNIMMTPSSPHYHRCWVLSLGDGGNRRQVKDKIRETALSDHIQTAEKYSAVMYLDRQHARIVLLWPSLVALVSKTKISSVMIHHKLRELHCWDPII